MRHLKEFNRLFENQQELTQEQKDWLDECTGGKWQVNPKTGLVDVEGWFDCRSQGLTDFKGLRFGNVSRGFYCGENKLTSLEGAPQHVGEGFNCSRNEIKSLKGGPKYVGDGFDCYVNNLESLKDGPDHVGQHFDCSRNEIKSLEGAPNRVDGYFKCSYNKLKSLKHAPEYVKRDFKCSFNKLTSLEGAPQSVGGYFYCEDNPISESAIRGVLMRMSDKKIPLEVAVEELWDELPEEDQVYLAKHHTGLSDEEKRIYRAIELNMKRA